MDEGPKTVMDTINIRITAAKIQQYLIQIAF